MLGLNRLRVVLATASCLLLWMACQAEVPSSSDSVVPILSASQMESTVAAALDMEEPVLRMKTLSTAIESLSRDNVAGAAEAFAANRPTATIFDIHPFMSQWATFDPESAMAFAGEGLKEGAPRRQGYQSIVFSWVASGGGEEAFAYGDLLTAEGSPLSETFESLLIQALILNEEFRLAMPLLEAKPEGTERNGILLKLTFELANKGVSKLIDWSQSVSIDAPNNLKSAIFSQAMSVVARSDPERAAAWFDEQGYQDFIRGDAMALIVVEWVKYDPVAALEWAIAQPPSDARDAAVRGGIYRWQTIDPATSEPWIREHISDRAMQVAIYPFAQWLLVDEPEEAVQWGLRVPLQPERYYVVQQAFIRWRREDPESAMEWLEASDLPAELRRDIDGLILLQGGRVDRAAGSNGAVAEEAGVSGQP